MFGLLCFTLSMNCMNRVPLYEGEGILIHELIWVEHVVCMRWFMEFETMGLAWLWHEIWGNVDQWMWHGVGRWYTPTLVICEGWVGWIQYEIQVRMEL